MIGLPRQARDKHRETLVLVKRKRVFFFLAGWSPSATRAACTRCATSLQVRKTPLFEPFIYKQIILSRQAQEKHREKMRKEDRFSQEKACRTAAAGRRPSSLRHRSRMGASLYGISSTAPVRTSKGEGETVATGFRVRSIRKIDPFS